jgi:hypothetical protein
MSSRTHSWILGFLLWLVSTSFGLAIGECCYFVYRELTNVQ